MSWAVITLTRNSFQLGLRVKKALNGQAVVYTPQKVLDYREAESGNAKPTGVPFKSFIKSIYKQHDGLIFIMATGIVVRSLDGLLEHKSKDPAVLVMDENGSFIIPLLSGHLGGGNEMAQRLATRLKATPVITTASDIQGKMAVDMLAKKLGFAFEDFTAATKVSGKIVNDEVVSVFTEIPLPQWVEKFFPVVLCDQDQLIKKSRYHSEEPSEGAILVSSRNLGKPPGPEKDSVIQLYPKNLILGLGARKNIATDHVEKSIKEVLIEFGYSALSIKHFATVDIKKEEPGILQGIKEFNRPLKIVTREAIKAVEGDFDGSDFVKESIGVRAVAEPAAYLTSGKDGEFIFGKRKINGLTIALWKENCH